MSDRIEEIRERDRWAYSDDGPLAVSQAQTDRHALLAHIDALEAYIAANHEHCSKCEEPYMPAIPNQRMMDLEAENARLREIAEKVLETANEWMDPELIALATRALEESEGEG